MIFTGLACALGAVELSATWILPNSPVIFNIAWARYTGREIKSVGVAGAASITERRRRAHAYSPRIYQVWISLIGYARYIRHKVVLYVLSCCVRAWRKRCR